MCIKINISIMKNHKNLKSLPSEDALLSEYQSAQEQALQADTIGWQISAILIAAVLVAFGRLIDLFSTANSNIAIIIIFFINLFLSFWILLFLGQHQVWLMKLYRVREIEKELGLKSNYYWELGRNGGKKGKYRTYGISGINLSIILFCILVLSSIIFGVLDFLNLENTNNSNTNINLMFLILSVLFPTISLAYGCCKIERLKDYIRNNP